MRLSIALPSGKNELKREIKTMQLLRNIVVEECCGMLAGSVLRID